MHSLARQCGLIEAIDRHVQLLQFHFPYHESDHVLNIDYNAMTDGKCLEDLELKRGDEAYLNALGTTRIPDPASPARSLIRGDALSIACWPGMIRNPSSGGWSKS